MNINPRLLTGIYKLLQVTEVSQTQDTVQVSSTCLSEVSYDLSTQTLTVEFKQSGSRYEYYNVPESDYEQLVATFGSVGETYNDIIKGVYNYSRVG